MGDLSQHFDRSEFACKCGCGKDAVDYALIVILEQVRAHFHAPIKVNSGNRCKAYNQQIGGSKKSQHTRSKAADIVINGVSPSTVYSWLDLNWPDSLGLGKYNTFTHVDVRDTKARWEG